MVSQWPWCPSDRVPAVMVSQWPLFPSGHGVPVVMVSQWPWCPSNRGVPVVMVSQWPWCPNDRVPVVMVSQWPWCPSGHGVRAATAVYKKTKTKQKTTIELGGWEEERLNDSLLGVGSMSGCCSFRV